MKTTHLLVTLLLLSISLSACQTSTATPTGQAALEEIYAAITETAAAQATLPTATVTPQPTVTPTPQPAATLLPTLTPPQTSPTPTPTLAANAVAGCDNAVYVSDVTIPDGTVFAPGVAFTKTWKMRNTGTCAWNTSYALAFTSGESMSGTTTALTSSASPGTDLDVSVKLVAPTTAGRYTGYWRLRNASGVAFGESIYVIIVVSASAATGTMTSTATSATTSTPTGTPAISILTSTPTSTTPEATSTPTDTPEPTVATAYP